MRREHFTFVESESDLVNRKAFCQICEETSGRLNKLVPKYTNGVLDDKFKQCSYCGKLYPIYDVKFFAEYEPKGVPVRNRLDSTTKVVTASNLRIKNKHRPRTNNNDLVIPRLAGKEDKELKSLLKDRPGTINYISDDNDDSIED